MIVLNHTRVLRAIFAVYQVADCLSRLSLPQELSEEEMSVIMSTYGMRIMLTLGVNVELSEGPELEKAADVVRKAINSDSFAPRKAKAGKKATNWAAGAKLAVFSMPAHVAKRIGRTSVKVDEATPLRGRPGARRRAARRRRRVKAPPQDLGLIQASCQLASPLSLSPRGGAGAPGRRGRRPASTASRRRR